MSKFENTENSEADEPVLIGQISLDDILAEQRS